MSTNYQIQRDSVLTIEYGSKFYVLDALGSFTYSQTYSRTVKKRKTLHRKTPAPLTLIQGVSTGNASLEVICTLGTTEEILLELLGLERDATTWRLPYSLAVEPLYFNVYIETNGSTKKLEKCVLTGMDLSFNPKTTQQFNIAIQFSELIEDVPAPSITQTQGDMPQGPNPMNIGIQDPLYGSIDMNSLKFATVSLQQDISWRSDNNIQTIGSLHKPTVAIIQDMPLSMIISTYETDQVIPPIAEHTTINLVCGMFHLTISDTFMTKRLEVADVMSIQYDISLQESSDFAVAYGETN